MYTIFPTRQVRLGQLTLVHMGTIPHPFSSLPPFSSQWMHGDVSANDTGNIAIAGSCHRSQASGNVLGLEFFGPEDQKEKVVSRSNRRVTGRYPCLKMHRQIEWRTWAEREAHRLLDSNPFVREMKELVCTIHYQQGGERQAHVPAGFARTNEGSFFWDALAEVHARSPRVAERTKLLVEQLPRFGFRYVMLREEDLRVEPRLTNVRQLLKLGRQPLSFAQWISAHKIFCCVDNLRWGDVVAGRYPSLGMHQVCRLILDRQLQFDIDQIWAASTYLAPVRGSILAGGHHV